MYLNTNKLEIKKRSVSLTISLELDKNEAVTDKVVKLLNIAIDSGASKNILKQVFNEDGTLKIKNKHTFH